MPSNYRSVREQFASFVRGASASSTSPGSSDNSQPMRINTVLAALQVQHHKCSTVAGVEGVALEPSWDR
eukprot:901322-Amphidinium_carterae.1